MEYQLLVSRLPSATSVSDHFESCSFFIFYFWIFYYVDVFMMVWVFFFSLVGEVLMPTFFFHTMSYIMVFSFHGFLFLTFFVNK
jgi:hypothetical protein